MNDHSGTTPFVVEEIIRDSESYLAVETFKTFHELQRLKHYTERVMDKIDTLVVAHDWKVCTVEEVRERPIDLNSNLEYHTNFVNLLDLAAVAVPTGRALMPAQASGLLSSVMHSMTESSLRSGRHWGNAALR